MSEVVAFPVPTFRSELSPTTRKEFDAFSAQLGGYLSAAGFTQGGDFDTLHGREVQAEQLTLKLDDDIATLKMERVSDVDDYPIVHLESEDAQQFRVTLREGLAASLGSRPAAASPVEQRFYDALTAMGSLRLRGQGTYTPAASDTDAFPATYGPQYSAYRMTPAADATIHGIDVDLAEGGHGHVIVAWNDSAFNVTFDDSLVVNAQKILGADLPLTIGPQGSVIIVYDTNDLGWRIVAYTGSTAAASDGTFPGMIAFQAMSTVGADWLLCDGSVKAQATYAALFAAIGTTWNTGGEGAGNFRLPPGGVFPLATGGTPAQSVGAQGGAWNHTHGAGSLGADSGGAHTHSVSGTTGGGSAHSHTIAQTEGTDMDTTGGGSYVEYPVGTAGETGAESAHTHGAGSLGADSGGAHTHTVSGTSGTANPPYAALVMVIHI